MAALAPRYRELAVELEVVRLRETPRSVLEDFLEAGATSTSIDLGVLGRPRAAAALTRLIRRCQPDLVHTTLFEADVLGRLAARLAGIPVVSSIVNESYGPEHVSDPGVRLTRLRAAQALDATTAHLTAGACTRSRIMRQKRWRDVFATHDRASMSSEGVAIHESSECEPRLDAEAFDRHSGSTTCSRSFWPQLARSTKKAWTYFSGVSRCCTHNEATFVFSSRDARATNPVGCERSSASCA